MNKFLRCPLTNLIFLNPVVAEDGYIYERDAITYCFNSETIISPVTRQKMGSNLVPVLTIKNMINELPDLSDQFLNKYPYFLFKQQFINNLKDKQTQLLIKYTDITLVDYFDKKDLITLSKIILINCDDSEIIKVIINNSIDYDIYDHNGFKLIHYACIYSNQDIIKYLIDNKKVNIDETDPNNNLPIHLIAKYQSSYDKLIYIFKDNLNKKNKTKNVAHIICKHLNSLNKFKSLLVILNNNFDILEEYSTLGYNCFHYVCRYGIYSVINEFFKLNINIKNETITHLNIHDLIYKNNNISKAEKMKLISEYLLIINANTIISDYV